jgi:arginyl-tRNA synthetase
MNAEEKIIATATAGIKELYNAENVPLAIQRTRPDFEGDFTLVVFPLLRYSHKSPEQTAEELGNYLKENIKGLECYNVVKGFLNLSYSSGFWIHFFRDTADKEGYGFKCPGNGAPTVIEYSSPNTNKPLHLGHVRNNLLGWSVAEILKANGKKVAKVNLVNDRGIHICKTMLAWQKMSDKKSPGELDIKGDKLVGDLYVEFEKANATEMKKLMEEGMDKDEAYRNSPLIKEANSLLKKWEDGDEEALKLWNTLNSWVYEGFEQTYTRMGVDFDKIYYESDTYLLGKELVKEGLEKGVFYKKNDGSVWADLSKYGLDQKLLLRADGTSVYITQDLGTAELRYDDYDPSALLYVVGNEQDYHFNILKLILKDLGRDWAETIRHVSYGMVELPEGKMKSREGKVVDADDLMEEMHATAAKMTMELGKIDDPDTKEASELFETIGMGALKYFILKVDPKKNMLFNPEESIDFNGNTGPFIQYTHARIKSLLRKGEEHGYELSIVDSGWSIFEGTEILPKEVSLIKLLYRFPAVIHEAAEQLSPALVANYSYELAREYNQYYQEIQVLKEPNKDKVVFRLSLNRVIADVIARAMGLLGINVPERM